MIGGRVQQVVGDRVEVLDLVYFDRAWRLVETTDIQDGDTLWWQSFTGYLSRAGQFADRNIGSCRPANDPAADVEEQG